MNFIRQREKHNGRLPVKAEAHRGWLPRRQGIDRHNTQYKEGQTERQNLTKY